jgi:hypothetical protein
VSPQQNNTHTHITGQVAGVTLCQEYVATVADPSIYSPSLQCISHSQHRVHTAQVTHRRASYSSGVLGLPLPLLLLVGAFVAAVTAGPSLDRDTSSSNIDCVGVAAAATAELLGVGAPPL